MSFISLPSAVREFDLALGNQHRTSVIDRAPTQHYIRQNNDDANEGQRADGHTDVGTDAPGTAVFVRSVGTVSETVAAVTGKHALTTSTLELVRIALCPGGQTQGIVLALGALYMHVQLPRVVRGVGVQKVTSGCTDLTAGLAGEVIVAEDFNKALAAVEVRARDLERDASRGVSLKVGLAQV